MATQKRVEGADLWFVTNAGTQKLRDLAADPHINLSYYEDRTREWVSVSGRSRAIFRQPDDKVRRRRCVAIGHCVERAPELGEI
jgi:general stress protein 26